MKISTLVIMSTLLLYLTACFTEVDEDIKHQDFNEDNAVLIDEDLLEKDTVVVWLSAEAFELKFDSLSVYLDSLEFYLDTTNKTGDTVLFDLELGSSLGSRYFKVETLFDSCSIIVLQQFETSLTIQNEGPHCDLTDWKHYYSEPDTLSLIDSSGVYQFKNNYEDSTRSNFPDVKMKEVLKAIKENCDEEWMNLVKESENVNSYPLSVSISKEIIKILVIDEAGEIIQEKILIFMVPMGC